MADAADAGPGTTPSVAGNALPGERSAPRAERRSTRAGTRPESLAGTALGEIY